MINFNFTDKKYLITGASSGIGAAIADLVVNSGGTALLISRDEKKLRARAEKLGGCRYCAIDLADVTSINGQLTPELKDFGPIDGFVHSAGIGTVRPLKLCTYDFMKLIMDINFFSFVEIVRLVTKKNCFNEGLSIVGISSVASQEGNQSKTGYCASKAAMDAAIRCIAKELSGKKIRVNSVMPGITKTAIFNQILDNGGDSDDLKNIMARQYLGICEPENIAAAVCFLLSEEARFITGSSLTVDSGRLSS